jgi:hypothetical protein
MTMCLTAVDGDAMRCFSRVCVAVDPGAALRGAVVLRQFNDEGDDGLAKGRASDADECSMET